MDAIFLSLGTNVGDREKNLETARLLLAGEFEILKKSSIYETEPWGGVAQKPFLNQVVEVKTFVLPRELLKKIKKIELEMRRRKTKRWGPRVIDIDILFYGNLVIDEPDLVVPHKFLHERKFVLEPMNEIAPNFVHPVFGKKISEIFGKQFL